MDKDTMTMDKYSAFLSILVDRPAQGVLRLTLNRPDRLNALDADGHRELADIWRIVDQAMPIGPPVS